MNTKINKTRARMLWLSGKCFWITACNMPMNCGLLIDPSRLIDDIPTFDALVDRFMYYNCDNERGRYPHYYTAD